MSIFVSIFSLGSTPITVSSNISVESRPATEVPLYSDAPLTYFKGWDYSDLSATTRRLVDQYSRFPVDIPTEVKAVQ